jgi:hypothetical protein
MTEQISSTRGVALIVLGAVMVVAAAWALSQWDRLSVHGVPLWILGVILAPIGVWFAIRGNKARRR